MMSENESGGSFERMSHMEQGKDSRGRINCTWSGDKDAEARRL